jgi:3-oxoadipate enol-lactonase
MPYAAANGIQLYYERHGSGFPLVLICGFAMTIEGWPSDRQPYAAHYHVVTFDNRGAGRSDAPPGGYTTAQMADDVAGLLDVLDIDHAHVFGASMGGHIALEFALRHPKRISGLVLAMTADHVTRKQQHLLRVWQDMREHGLPEELLIREKLHWLQRPSFFENARAIEVWVQGALSMPLQTQEGYAGQTAACIHHDTREQVHRITAPTLVIAAEQDQIIPCSAAREMAARIPRAELVIIPDAAHVLTPRQYSDFDQAVLGFLATCPTGGQH